MTQPNVVLVLTDDQGYGDLSCLGNPVVRTPYMDRLHAESVRLTDFHVAPMCTPTRGELLTGRDALYNGATFVCMGRALLRGDLPTMADIFAANGYHTGHFGKWHLGDNYPYRPQDRGFHETVYHPAWGITSAPDYFGNDYFDDHYRRRDEIRQYRGYCTDVWFEQAIAWMRRCHRRGDPFFTYIATNAPHTPLWVPNQFRQPYLGEVTRNEASFYGMIANIDENMGRLDSFLGESGLRENAILIFMTDNGTATGENVFNAGMRGKKRSLYDGGHRVPLFMRWPNGGIGGGRGVHGLTRSTDVLPSLIDLCGLHVDAGLTFDGLSLAAALQEDTEPQRDRMAVVQYGHANKGTYGHTEKDNAAVLWQKWRLVNGTELYDISTDVGQTRDVSASNLDVVSRMQDYYERWWDEVGDNLDSYEPITIGTDHENPVRLSSCDWAGVYADNQQNIRGCVMNSGAWHVDVARAGLYDLTLRRWPEESGLGIAAPAPVMQGFDGTLPEGAALPVGSAWIRAGEAEQTKCVPEGANHVTFRMALNCGMAQLKSWWHDKEGNRLAGAYYLTAARVSE
ncbi:MAG: arylsulfatase [Candidatus Poribacteria bacterium]|nr:arylsulfatase [Candidatus Poribacteria bacterium]